MVRVKGGNITRKHRKKILYLAKGFRGSHSKIFRMANEQVMKALKYSYVGRKQKKDQFRKLWITRINATSRKAFNLNYSRFIHKVKIKKIKLNRKMLSQIAILDNSTFNKILLEISV
jgi:large subunit ribosomal protein L20